MNHHARNIKSIRLVTAFFLFLFMALPQAEIKEACDLRYMGDASELKDSIIRAPHKIMSMSQFFKVEMAIDTFTTIVRKPLSIFFVIDHSKSMSGTTGKDLSGSRFTVAQTYIDSLYKTLPKSEIGIAVFREHLYFDPADNARFVKAPGNDTGAYLPFFRLDSSYAPDGKLGYQIVREMLDTTIVNGTAELKYVPTNAASNPGNTNINCGLDAVKHAFKSAKYKTHRQRVFFFSGSESNTVNGPHTDTFAYAKDVSYISDVPATFTVYFTNSGTAPWSIDSMANHIKNNGYSTVNPQSDRFPISSDTLLQFMFNTFPIYPKYICQWIISRPISITVNGNTVNNWDSINQVFTFDDRFPLTGQSTPFKYKINYKITWDSIPITGDTTITIVKDSTDSGSYAIFIDPAVSNPPANYKHLFDMFSWKRELALYYNGKPVSLVNKVMNTLELRFIYSQGNALFNYTKADVEVSNTTGATKDKEIFTLIKNDTLFTKTFSLTIDSNPTQNNGILQVYENDTIFAVFRNNESTKLPLDTIRIAVPFIATAAIQSNPIISDGTFSFNLIKNGRGNYRLKYNNLPADGKVKLYTINGRKVFERQIIKGNSSIELPKAVSHSIYLIQVHYGEKVCKKKVLLR